ncbi:helix-turn-helix domain-containing protein [Microvirga yunnanensis]|uniref:helix-turn-helix domain-containing protein n=1 Tax=Microvirga yunnanensis TaxID=2953740 RepID=UPI00359FBF49
MPRRPRQTHALGDLAVLERALAAFVDGLITVANSGTGGLYDIPAAARRLKCSRDHLLGLVHDGEIEYIDLARRGSKHREIRFTAAQLDAYASKRTRRNVSNPIPTSAQASRPSQKTVEPVSAASFAERFRAKHGA